MADRKLLDPNTIALKEEALFNDWKATMPDGADFIPDGAANPEKYCKAPLRLLYILKEPNGSGPYDIREVMKSGDRLETWTVIARWTQALFERHKDIDWYQISNQNVSEQIQKYNSCVAAINLKKVPGKHVANNSLIISSARKDKTFIRRQIEIYQPDIIILCGTEPAYTAISDNPIEWKMTRHGVRYYYDENERLTISYSHPKARVSPNILHYGLVEAVQKIMP